MMTVAVLNQKGGVAKTTTTANLGACLAERGLRTLLIDLDPQANLTLGLGVEWYKLECSLQHVLLDPEATPMSSILVHCARSFGFGACRNDAYSASR
jgi:chromosome partitioning protein